MEIRKTTLEDLPAVMALYDQGRQYMRKNGNHSQWIKGYPSEELIREDIQLGRSYVAQEQGKRVRVFADETRPLLQGARLTAFELHQSGIDTTLLCDNMAAAAMKNGWIQLVLVGADRIAANGDTANKIGTLGVALLAHHYKIPFYVCAPLTTIDLDTPTGEQIQIEQRSPEEVTTLWYRERMAPAGIKVWNPAFDVTGQELITGIITDRGIARPPFDRSLAALFEARK